MKRSLSVRLDKEGKDLTQSDKKTYTNKNVKRANRKYKTDSRKFDYTAINDRFRRVRWSNYSLRTGVVNRLTFQTG